MPYTYHEHVPLLGEPLLRAAFGPIPTGQRATVPLLVDGPEKARSSTEIARYAERVGRGPTLFPEGADVARWDTLGEAVLNDARGLVLAKTAKISAARKENVPAFVPGPLRAAVAPMTALATTFVARKYGATADEEAAARAIRPRLEEVREALGGRATMFATFSWADICLATMLQAVRPHDGAALGPGRREAWTMPGLAAEFEDLLAWRDGVVARHR